MEGAPHIFVLSAALVYTNAACTSLVTDVRFDALHQLRGHLPDAMFLGMLSRFLEYFLFRLTPDNMLTPTRRVNLGTFQNLCHGGPPSLLARDPLRPFAHSLHSIPGGHNGTLHFFVGPQHNGEPLTFPLCCFDHIACWLHKAYQAGIEWPKAFYFYAFSWGAPRKRCTLVLLRPPYAGAKNV